jgi:hypothetical protein
VLKVVLKCDIDSDFGCLLNDAALLLSLSSGVHNVVKTQIFAIVAKLIRKIAVFDDVSVAIQMIGVFSAMLDDVLDTSLPVLTTRSDMIRRTIRFILRGFIRENVFEPFHPATKRLQKGIDSVLPACL